jgi:hypothetical protein
MTSATTTFDVSTEYMFQMLSVLDTVAKDIETEGPTELDSAALVIIDKPWSVVMGM